MTGVLTFAMPDELMEAFVQWLRDFDSQHPGCTFQVLTNTQMTSAEIEQVLKSIKPGFPQMATFTSGYFKKK